MKCYTNITSNLYKYSKPKILEFKAARGWLLSMSSHSLGAPVWSLWDTTPRTGAVFPEVPEEPGQMALTLVF